MLPNLSLWTINCSAIVGEMTGTKLAVLPSDQIEFGNWKKLHPQGQVLSRDTGATRFYGRDPYGDYYRDNSEIAFPVKTRDDRLLKRSYNTAIWDSGCCVSPLRLSSSIMQCQN